MDNINDLLMTMVAITDIDEQKGLPQSYEELENEINGHIETYIYNAPDYIKCELYNRLTTDEERELWRKDIKYAMENVSNLILGLINK